MSGAPDGNIRIRAASVNDAQALLDIYAPYVLNTAVSFEYDVPTVSEFAGRIERVLTKYPYLVAERDGVLLGYAYVGTFHARAAYDWAVETSIYVRQDVRRGGIGRGLHDALERVLRAQGIINMNAAIAYAKTEDEYLTWDSVRFHERLGYRRVGEFEKCGCKFGRWYNLLWMEKMLGEHLPNPPRVQTFETVRESLSL